MKVSVIIPLYNAEKFFAVCLESLAIQTMTDFEVIVVDDCSTDSSLAIAESYLERFGGRLKIITLPQNTGNPAIPRNVGLEHARGEYVYFVDNDDLLIDNALETLYNFATEYGADVVYMEKFFLCDEEPVPNDLEPVELMPVLTEEEILIESDNVVERVKKFVEKHFFCSPWSKFLRRQLLIDNNITLPRMKIADDILWTLKIICFAKKILRIPAQIYVHRTNKMSISRRTRIPEKRLELYASPMIIAVEMFEEFMSSIDLFARNPDLRLRVLMFFLQILFDDIEKDLKSLMPAQVYEIFLREFKANSTHPALISCLIVMMNIYHQTLKEREKS